jgi:hypothetical protein
MTIADKHSSRPGSRTLNGPLTRRGAVNTLNPAKASEALADSLLYIKDQWKWSGSKIARVLHLSANTVNFWLKKGIVPISSKNISPDIEAVIHLAAIHRSLAAMFSEAFHQLQWLETEHPDFGVAPLSKMSGSIADLIQVRQYLDFVRGRGA